MLSEILKIKNSDSFTSGQLVFLFVTELEKYILELNFCTANLDSQYALTNLRIDKL